MSNHTEKIKGFWSEVKREITDVPWVSVRYLQPYVDEYVWRFNHRNDGRTFFRLPVGFPDRLTQLHGRWLAQVHPRCHPKYPSDRTVFPLRALL
jgi:hypothetical protein